MLIFLLAAATAPPLTKGNLLSWPSSDVKTFGCFLEKELAIKDAKFNCRLGKYKASTNPRSRAYNEGPAFPREKAATIHALVKEVELDWEHGELREVTLTLTKRMTEAEVRAAFKLPKELPENVMSIRVEECSSDASCLSLTGFEHQGAGD